MNVLLLQGPLGPFFSRLQKELHESGHNCWRVALNGGDLFQSHWSESTLVYRGAPSEWFEWLDHICQKNNISHIFVYGDCRLYHRDAKHLCQIRGIEFYAFEEGYIRPNYVTFERSGVNANSKICLEDIKQWSVRPWPKVKPVKWGFFAHGIHAITYYIALSLSRYYFKNYVHHRNDSASRDAFGHLRSAYRKFKYSLIEKKYWRILEGKSYFLVTLQVSYDSQINFHSAFENVEQFIDHTIESFANNADPSDYLVLKHHPADRGNNHYGKFLEKCGKKYNISDRIIYVHDLNLPRMLKAAKGVVTVNSTSAISSYHHDTPVKILGRTFYDLPGLSDQKPLDQFWQSPTPASKDLYLKLRNYLEYHSQINGNFYCFPSMTSKLVLEKLPQRQNSVIYADMVADL